MGKPHQLAGSRIGKLVSSNRDALLCLIDQGIVSVAGFATSVLIGRLAPTQLGVYYLSLIHISEPTRLRRISYAVFCLKKKKQ